MKMHCERAYDRAEDIPDEGMFAEPAVTAVVDKRPPALASRDPSRGRSNENAAAAWKRCSRSAQAMRDVVLERVRAAGIRGVTLKEFVERFNGSPDHVTEDVLTLNGVSGRFSELKEAGLIRQSPGLRVEGCGVWILAEGPDTIVAAKGARFEFGEEG